MTPLLNSAEQITSEITSSAQRLINLANGELAPNTGNGNERIYSRPPHQVAIEYIVDRAIGRPGVKITFAPRGYADEHQSPANSVPTPNTEHLTPGSDYKSLLLDSRQLFIDALPMAIERLKELAAGVTVRKIVHEQEVTVYRKPSSRAIEYIANRVAGKSGSILEDIKAEEAAEEEAQDEARNNEAGYPQDDQDEQEEQEEPPQYVVDANNDLAAFLPEAIKHMTSLARGAQTIVDTLAERRVYNHEPDYRANIFLINRFMGAPPTEIEFV